MRYGKSAEGCSQDGGRPDGGGPVDELPVGGGLRSDCGLDTRAYGFDYDADMIHGGWLTDYGSDGSSTSWGDGRWKSSDASVVLRSRCRRGGGAFVARCATRSIVGAAMNVMNPSAVKLAETMEVIIGGREVPWLTNNGTFRAFKEQEPLQAPESPRLVSVHEQNALRLMVDQDSFEKLSNAVVLSSNDELLVVPFACATGGVVGAGVVRGSGGTGSSGG